MENTSLGFHTISIHQKLTIKEAKELMWDFERYKEKVGEIEIFPIHKTKLPDDADEFTKWLFSSFSQYFIVHYPNQNKGVLWLLRYSSSSPGFIQLTELDRPCSIKATINPKILTGKNDYLSAATIDDLSYVEELFNIEAKKISPILKEYKMYSMNRPDYCINFDLGELKIPCTSEQMIYLIKHGDIPKHFSERMEYNEISKRIKSDRDSFYLESGSVTINCYRKPKQLMEKFPNCPNLEASRDLIRFEVQCKYMKAYTLSKAIKNKPGISNSEVICEMLSEDFCTDIIREYFYRIIKRGDYFTLDGAIRQVQLYHFKRSKETRLINELRRINRFRGIHKVRDTLQGDERDAFSRTLRHLSAINVNPVTIPKDWNIARIPSLLDVYERRVEDERQKIWREEFQQEYLEEYCREKRSKNKQKRKKKR